MISCTEFIPAYSELFRFLEQRDGEEAVLRYWEAVSRDGIGALKKLVETHGIRGCYLYWSHTLNEEAADFTMTLDEDAGVFRLDMTYCPSKGRLLALPDFEPYHNYCGHCDVLYRRVLEALGYVYEFDASRCDRAQCAITVKKGGSAHQHTGINDKQEKHSDHRNHRINGGSL